VNWSDKFTRRRGGRIIIIKRNGAKTISLQSSFGDLKIIIIIIITKIDCVWMQTHNSLNEPLIRIQGTNQFLTSKYC
jgi:hypothetical protein